MSGLQYLLNYYLDGTVDGKIGYGEFSDGDKVSKLFFNVNKRFDKVSSSDPELTPNLLNVLRKTDVNAGSYMILGITDEGNGTYFC